MINKRREKKYLERAKTKVFYCRISFERLVYVGLLSGKDHQESNQVETR
jgi:hypothetical protein